MALLAALPVAACVVMPDGAAPISLRSRTYGFIDQLLAGEAGQAQSVGASLVLPDPARHGPPYAALVLLHTSYGQGSQDWLYAKRLADAGLAVLAIDSFTARGVSHTVRDQTLVSTASILTDAFAGLDHLTGDPRIDPARIGILGFSKGGIAALYSAYRPIHRRLAPPGRAFAVHVAYYPWCGLALREPVTTGAPVLIQSGALDDVVPAAQCQALVAASRGPGGGPNMKMVVHANARHGFDHPLLAVFGKIPLSEPSPANCLLEEQSDGRFRERQTGLIVNSGNLREVLTLCSRPGAAGGNGEAAEQAFAETLAFLSHAGFLAPRAEALGVQSHTFAQEGKKLSTSSSWTTWQ